MLGFSPDELPAHPPLASTALIACCLLSTSRSASSAALVGLALGLAGAFVLTHFLSGLLFGVAATDPVTFLAVPGIVLLAALLASWVPAQRATEADPMSILRAS